MARKFPQNNSDGSFSFDAIYVFEKSSSLSATQINNWLKDWVENNDPWIREWTSGHKETLNFSDEFLSMPKVIDIDETGFKVKIEGNNGKYWKDWFVRVSSELIDSHIEIKELLMH